MPDARDCDVIVFGGGLAGMSAALQLKRLRPETRIVCAEKRTFPVPEGAYKVGESAAEVGAHYLKEGIGFRKHMEEDQLRKFSLRIFSPSNGNSDITRRPEFGFCRLSPLRTYQIDRGRLENALATAVDDSGVEFLQGSSVSAFSLGPDRHTATVKDEHGRTREYTARWIIDASGRVSLLRRQLGLTVDIPHDVNAAWFRVPYRLSVDDWSEDEAWRARVPNGRRWASTCHLVGEGYWVWLIPLASGSHSVGVVADPNFVPFEKIRRYDTLLEWARENEPQLAEKLPDSEDGLLDFRKLKNYAYGTRRGLSPDRWALTGEAGLFLDPLFSTGFDFIAVANTLSTRLISGALDDEPDVRKRLKAYNRFYLGQFMGWEPAFAGQYEIFRDAQATSAKLIWDNASYFMFPVPMITSGHFLDYEFTAKMVDEFRPHFEMNVHMQRLFREWSRSEYDRQAAGFVYGTDPMVEELFHSASGELTQAETAEIVTSGVRRLKALSWEMYDRMTETAGLKMEAPTWDRPTLDESIVGWSSYEQRTAPPAQTEPQPADSWMLR
jgi:flavin-dependent dehydrogenase